MKNNLENEVNEKKDKKSYNTTTGSNSRPIEDNAGAATPLSYVASRWERCKAAI